MENIRKVIVLILLMAAVAAYCVYNYMAGKTDLSMLIVSLAVICLPMVNIISITIRNWRNQK